MSEKREYTTVRREASDEFEEKRSVFIGHARHIDCEADALDFIKAKKKEYYDARHNVYAYVLEGGNVMRYSDDGEPQGTGGIPVLETIKKSGVSDVCVVVTRYFGGILLGAGGLVRAYSHATAIAIEGGKVVTYEPYSEFSLRCGYSEYQKYSNILSNAAAVIDGTDFGADVEVRFAIKRDKAEELLKKISEAGYGRDIPQLVGSRFDCR